MNKNLRELLGDLPFTAEIDWMLRSKNRPRKDHFNLDRLQKSLPAAVEVVKPFAESAMPGKKVLFFATLHYWIEQSAYLGLVLAGMGHDVTLLTLPYSEWHKQKDKFTQRQRVLHTYDALACSRRW
ncbi:hypothetical protein [Candidatus Villigracilis affinis]|uniref:hypothetical protein n=1 Tax=Candidatus Villigracilis affinis TaxID=3140682 RepID=UPI001DD2D611|nr:hypothetical protein [Anaerolineales bacterium]